MGLDARVHCNCYEMGKLRIPPPHPELVYVDKDGGLECRAEDNDEIYFEFDRWLHEQACEHEDGIMLHHWIGNIAQVTLLRQALQREAGRFLLILSKILYNGVHSGDYIEVDEVVKIQTEVEDLSLLHSDEPQTEWVLREFEKKMVELVHCSLVMNKPIVF